MRTAVIVIVCVIVATLVARRFALRGRGMVALLVAGLIAFPFVWHEIGEHHLFAPPDPYGPCPAPTHYIAKWAPIHGFDQFTQSPGESVPTEQMAGVVVYHGWVELAGCGMSIQLGAGTR